MLFVDKGGASHDPRRPFSEAGPGGPSRRAAGQKSPLLFPSDTGGFRSRSVLDKPFREVAAAIGLGKHVTPRAMRRTYQDLARAAEMRDLVTRAISGHATEQMQQHYSTVAQTEMREGIAKIISLAGVREALVRAGGTEVVWTGDENKKAS